MAKCKACGKKGLFLKLQKGLCSMCLDTLFPEEGGFMGLTKDMFLHPEEYKTEEKPLQRNTADENPGKITTENGSKIDVALVPDVFAIDGIARIDGNFYELTSKENIEKATEDIESLNSLIDEAVALCRIKPATKFEKKALKFKFNPHCTQRDYCIVSFSGLTNTGKIAKHVITLSAKQGDCLFGEIKYDKYGKVSRATISESVLTRITKPYVIETHNSGYRIIAERNAEKLMVRFVYTIKDGTRTKIYDSKA